jgi:hypothetical protein
MKVKFSEAVDKARDEFDSLRSAAENKELFDKAADYMKKQDFVCDLSLGSVKAKKGWQAQFVNYDWADNYIANPDHVFYDYFRGILMNKYSRYLREID